MYIANSVGLLVGIAEPIAINVNNSTTINNKQFDYTTCVVTEDHRAYCNANPHSARWRQRDGFSL
ncbi:hypothetical protein [Rubripirellula amarantea]|uniref:hypothetical protein n=1 Tax=Rubripirellula amarantea TaxID=2527999 RepID=UPI0011B726A2|nr:hypothetical protein [Rubripirellula amarantea]